MISHLRPQSPRCSLAILLACLAWGPAFAQTFESPHIVEEEGTITGVAWSVAGGQPNFDFVDGKVTPGVAGHRTLWGLGGNVNVNKWIGGTFSDPAHPMEASFSMYSLIDGQRKLAINGATLSSVLFPGCDANRKEAGGIVTTFVPSSIVDVGPALVTKAAKDTAKRQKMWLCSNFRLSIGDLPCQRVTKTEAFGAKFKKSAVDFDDILFQVHPGDAPAFEQAFRTGLTGVPKEYPFRLEYVDEDGNLLLGLVATVIITGVGPTDIFEPVSSTGASLSQTYTVHAKVKPGGVGTSPTTGELEIIIQ